MTAKTYCTAYIVDGRVYLVDGEENRFHAHDRLTALWKEIARPGDLARLIDIEQDTHEALKRAWPEMRPSFTVDTTSDHDVIMNLEEGAPAVDYFIIYNFRSDANRDEIATRAEETKWTNGSDVGRPLSPTLELLNWERGEEELAFVGAFGLKELSLAICEHSDDPHTSHLIDVRLGPWDHIPVHGDHLAKLADIATKMDARCAQYLREEAEGWQEEIDIAAERASAARP